MSYNKTILCLANSRRPTGRCIAGKEVVSDGYGNWLRPVSARDSEEISEEERRYEDGTDPKVLDIIRILFLEPRPTIYQTENHVIDDQDYWEKVDQAGWNDVIEALDLVPGPLWQNVGSTRHGLNDKIPENIAGQFSSSLCLIRPDDIEVHVEREDGDFGPPRRRVRASFILNDTSYKFVITDPIIERHYLAQSNGSYSIEDAIFCISLSGLFQGHAYKLVATMITPT
ncbi:MAG: hypothetical protein IIB65_06700 [Proteobacteria bacterium]|nr:hypothetical protein [Pseudomonadota bacterium]